MSKYTAVLQEPVVELSVEGTDASGKKATMIVGFKRYGTEKKKVIQQRLLEMIKPLIDYQEESQDQYESYKFVNGLKVPDGELTKKGATFDEQKLKDLNEKYITDQIEFVKESISYAKHVKLVDPSTGKTAIEIPDTRTFQDKAVWEDEGYTGILPLILDVYTDSELWRNALYDKAKVAIENKEEERKAKSKN